MAASAFIAFASLKVAALFGVHLRAFLRETGAEAKTPPMGEIASVGDTQLHMKVEGLGPPLVMLHGAGGNMRDFERLVPELARTFTVVRFDRPGLGHSGLPKGYRSLWRNNAPSPEMQAELMATAYERLNLGPALILGQSYGGAVALGWALRRPQSAAGVVLVSAASQPWQGRISPLYPIASHPLGAFLIVPLITAFATKGLVRRALAAIFAPQRPPEGYAELIGAGLSLRRRAFRNNARQVHHLNGQLKSMAPDYGSIKLAVELIHGSADQIVPLEIHSIPTEASIPDAKLTVLPDIGHMPHHSAPQAVFAAIDRAAARVGWRMATSSGKVDS